jgi:hypothetical protein
MDEIRQIILGQYFEIAIGHSLFIIGSCHSWTSASVSRVVRHQRHFVTEIVKSVFVDNNFSCFLRRDNVRFDVFGLELCHVLFHLFVDFSHVAAVRHFFNIV